MGIVPSSELTVVCELYFAPATGRVEIESLDSVSLEDCSSDTFALSLNASRIAASACGAKRLAEETASMSSSGTSLGTGTVVAAIAGALRMAAVTRTAATAAKVFCRFGVDCQSLGRVNTYHVATDTECRWPLCPLVSGLADR